MGKKRKEGRGSHMNKLRDKEGVLALVGIL